MRVVPSAPGRPTGMRTDLEPEEDEEEDEAQELQPWQFSLRTLLIAVTLFAVLCALMKWWGAILVVAVCAYAVGMFIGLLIASYAGMDFEFGDLRWDILKCFTVAATIVLLVEGIIKFAPHPYVFLVVPVFMLVVTKLCWLELDRPAILLVSASALFSTAFAGSVMSMFLR